jgi:hypothetical protein
MILFVASFHGDESTIWGSSEGPRRQNITLHTQLVLHLYTTLRVIRFYTVYLIPALYIPTNSQSPLLLW